MTEKLPEFKIIRSNRKTLSLEVTRSGEAIVRAPTRISRARIDAFVRLNKEWLVSRMQKRAEKNARENVNDEEKNRLVLLAKRIIPEKVSHFARIMEVEPTGIKITSAQTRFGSCSAKNALCFSWRVMLYPEKAIDYVVVHELSHIIHHNHSKDFWKTVALYMPDYKEAEKLLKN